MQSVSVSTQNVSSHPIPIAFALLTLSGSIALLSILSGFHSSPVPAELAWQFSPIGLLQGINPEYADIPSGNYFLGPSGLSLDYARVFAKTCLCESPFYFWCFRRENWLRALLLLIIANILTHPAVFFVFPLLFSKYIHAALSAEFFAAAIEMLFVGIYLAKTQNRRAGLIGAFTILAANLFSWELGMYL